MSKRMQSLLQKMATTASSYTFNGSNSTSTQPTNVLVDPYFEIPFLIIIISVGVVGNLFIIGAALTEKRLRNMGVAFIINLAVADLAITAFHLPVVLANVCNEYQNVFEDSMWLCSVTAVIASLGCEVSMSTLMFISICRYCQVTRPTTSHKYFGKKQIAAMIVFIWVYCLLIALPLVVGWFGSRPLVHFDVNMQACMWNDALEMGFNILVVIAAIFIQISITAYMYCAIYMHVRKTSRSVDGCENRQSSTDCGMENAQSTENHSLVSSILDLRNITNLTVRQRIKQKKSDQRRRSEERERNMLLTLVVVVVFFILFWTPYALMILFPPLQTPLSMRAFGWLALSNSAVNSIIYGVLNRNFRHGYFNIVRRIWKLICLSCSARKSCSLSNT